MDNILLTSAYKSFDQAKEAAVLEAKKLDSSLELISYYDVKEGIGGAQETCAGEYTRCSEDYALSRGASLEVLSRDSSYRFFFGKYPQDYAQLDLDAVTEVHQGLKRDEFNNQQGG